MTNALSYSDSSKPKLLITGASGLLGHALCAQALPQWSVLALYRQNRPQVPGVRAIQIDLVDESEVRHLVQALAPTAIIHAAAVAQVGLCEAHPRQTATINVAVPTLLADLCAEKGIDYLFTSTDLVFDGQLAPYKEQNRVNPVCTYGEQKAQAEQVVLERCPKALVCRLPLMFGLAPYAERHFTLQMLSAFNQNRTVTLLTDEYRTPVDNNSAAQGILRVLGRHQGILHLGGRTRISRYDLGHLIATRMGVASDVIQPVTIEQLNFSASRPQDCALDSSKAYRLGFNPTPLEEAIKILVGRFGEITDG